MPTPRLIPAGILALLLIIPVPTFPRTWHILNDGTGDAPTIQAGIDSASIGDTVLVGPGTYLEHPDFAGKGIVLKSLSGPEQTILDGSGKEQPWVVAFRQGENQGAILDGFTITGGVVGISLWNSEPAILSNWITGNIGGGGILCNSDNSPSAPPWRPRIQGNRIEENDSSDNGGGIQCFSKYAPEIVDNFISRNRTEFGDGGGVYIRLTDSGTVISRNHLERNIAADHGGGIYAGWATNGSGNSALEISMNIIRENIAHGRAADFEGGGGIWLKESGA